MKIFLTLLALFSVTFTSSLSLLSFQLPVAIAQNNTKAEADRLRQQGEKQLEAGQYTQGTESLEQAMRIYQQLGDTEIVEKLKNILTQIYLTRGAYGKIEQINKKYINLNLGLLEMRNQNYAQARAYFEKVLREVELIRKSLEGEKQYVEVLIYIGQSYIYEQDYSTALSFLKRADEITEYTYEVTTDDFDCDFCLTEYKVEQNQYLIDKIKSRLSILLFIGEIYLQQGDPNQALSYFTKASTTANGYENALPKGVPIFWEDISLHISRAYFSLGKYEQTIIYANKSLKKDKKLKTSRDALSSIFFPLGNLQDAHSHIIIGMALNKLGQTREAEEQIEKAIQIFEAVRQKSISQTDIHESLKLFENQVRATSLLQQIIQAQNNSETALSISEWGRSRLLLEDLAVPKGLSLNEKADKIIESLYNEWLDLFFDYKYPNISANFRQPLKEKFIASIKEKCLASGQPEDCFLKFLLKQQNNPFLQESPIKNTLNADIFYRSLVKPGVRRPNPEELKQIARSHKATIVEYSIVSETTFFHSNVTSIEQVEQWIKSSSSIDLSNSNPTVMDFFKGDDCFRGFAHIDAQILCEMASSAKGFDHTSAPWNAFPGEEKKLVIWVIKPTGEIKSRQIDLKKQKIPIKDLVTNTRQTMGLDRSIGVFLKPDAELPDGSTRNPSEVQAKEKLKQLHELLIEPIADLLPSNPEAKVVFVPHKELFLVPFAALIDSKDKYLIEKHTIITAPSIQALDITQQKRQKQTGKSKFAVVVGNPTMPTIKLPNNQSPTQLNNLPGAEREGKAVAQLLNAEFLTGNEATKAEVLKQLPNARYIHLATHGLLEDFASFGIPGAVALAPSNQDNGFLTSSEIQELNLQAELAVLSACDTGGGDITGDGIVGLSRALIVAGVPSIVVSLWSVPDAPTAELMEEFYRNFQERKLDKAQALRQAMLKIMKTKDNPVDWAGFTLIGQSK